MTLGQNLIETKLNSEQNFQKDKKRIQFFLVPISLPVGKKMIHSSCVYGCVGARKFGSFLQHSPNISLPIRLIVIGFICNTI